MSVKATGKSDMVHSPPHYTQCGSVECIDAIEAALGPAGFEAFLRGQVIRYIWRGPYKRDAEEDYRKAAWYLERLIATFDEGGGQS